MIERFYLESQALYLGVVRGVVGERAFDTLAMHAGKAHGVGGLGRASPCAQRSP